jgi:hypothetical protein
MTEGKRRKEEGEESSKGRGQKGRLIQERDRWGLAWVGMNRVVRGYGPDTWVTVQTGDMGDTAIERTVTESREAGDVGAERSATSGQEIGDGGGETWATTRRETGEGSAETSATSRRKIRERVVEGIAGDVRDMGDSERSHSRDALAGDVSHG